MMKRPSLAFPTFFRRLAAVLLTVSTAACSSAPVPRSFPVSLESESTLEANASQSPDSTEVVPLTPTPAEVQAPTSAPAEKLTPAGSTDPFKAIQLAWFYHAPPYDLENPQALADNFRLFISSPTMEDQHEEMKSLGAQGPFLMYMLFNEIYEPENCEEQPHTNQIADRPGDFCDIDQNHPDWFLTDSDGNRIHNVEPYTDYWFMDPGNPGWREFWLGRMREKESLGWDGFFLDNLETRPRVKMDKVNLPNYPTVESYQQAIIGFLQLIYADFQPKGVKVFANILDTEELNDWMQYIPYLDGAFLENFAVDWAKDEYLDVETWNMQLEMIQQTQAQGKDVVLVAQGNQDDAKRQEFAFATYLLAQEGKAYFRYTFYDDYDSLWLYMNYLYNPGRPLNEAYKQGNVWKRDFENGQVIVDPKKHTAKINMSK
jgi:hypothetical protein